MRTFRGELKAVLPTLIDFYGQKRYQKFTIYVKDAVENSATIFQKLLYLATLYLRE